MIIHKIKILFAMMWTWAKYLVYSMPFCFLAALYWAGWSFSYLMRHPELFGIPFYPCFIVSFFYMLQNFGAEYHPSSNRYADDGLINPSTGLQMHGGVDSSGTPF